MSDREFWMLVRQALLMFVDAIERRFLPDVQRTAEARRLLKTQPERSVG
jgi:hypothetical protein